MTDAKTTQSSSMDCAEGEDVNLPCNNYTIGRNDYIHSYQQNPNQSPQYVIHGLWSTVNSSMASLTTTSERKCSTLVLPQVTLRDTAVYYCILREAHWDRRGCTCAVSLVGRWGCRVGGAVTRANLEFGRRIRRAVRHEGNEGKGNGRKWIKKRRERGQGRSASLVDVAMNDKETKNHNFNTGIKWRGINSLSWLLLVSIKCWFQCVKDEKIRKIQIILPFQRLLSFGPRTNPYSETHIITVVSLAYWSYSEENLKCYFVITLEHMFVIKKILRKQKLS